MPDDDVIPRRVPRRWKKAARLAAGVGTPSELAPRLTKALSGTLRDSGGCPGLGAIGAALGRSARGEAEWSDEEAEVKAANGGHAHTAIALGIARSLLESRPEGLAALDEESIKQLLATEVLKRLTGRNFFGRIRPGLVASRFKSFEEAQQFEKECLDAVPLNDLGRRLLAHESGEGLVAPPTGTEAEGTAVLLHKPIAG